jgi:manganese transport protein
MKDDSKTDHPIAIDENIGEGHGEGSLKAKDKNTKLFERIKFGVLAIGPGLFLIGYNIGTGSIVTMSKAGATYGMALLWLLLLSCVFSYVLMVAYGQVTIVSKRTALNNIKIEFPKFNIGKIVGIYILVSLIIGELLALIGISGVVVELIQEGFRLTASGMEVNRTVVGLVVMTSMAVLFWFGNYKVFEKVLIFIVSIMVMTFMIVLVMIKPDFNTIIAGLVPVIPEREGTLMIMAAMAGTTISAAVFIVRSTVVAEKGWNIDHLKREKIDAGVSSFTMFLLSAVIMAVAAGTLWLIGSKVNSTLDLIHLFEPIGGKAATFLLILGICSAGISTMFPIILIAPWLICDYTGRPRNTRSPLFRIAGLAGFIIALAFLFIQQAPPVIILFSQAFQAMLLPAVVIPIVMLINRKSFMKEHVAGPWTNVGLALTLIFSLVTAVFAVWDLW